MTGINGVGQHRAERRCAAMIKIRYRNANELPPGLHATAERHGRTITIYLLPGLAAEERNAALRRLRLSGRMGHGPRLPGVQLGFALFADRVRATIGQAGSVFRKHPAGTTGLIMLISAGAIAFLVLSAVSIRVLREPRGPDGSPASGPAPAASAIAVRIPGSCPRRSHPRCRHQARPRCTPRCRRRCLRRSWRRLTRPIRSRRPRQSRLPSRRPSRRRALRRRPVLPRPRNRRP
jgi:hypothetical protein